MDWAEQQVQEQNKADEVVHFCAVHVKVDEAYSGSYSCLCGQTDLFLHSLSNSVHSCGQ